MYHIHQRGPILEISISGVLTLNGILTVWEDVSKFTTAESGLVRVVAGRWETTARDIEVLANVCGEMLPPIPWALFTEDPLSFGMLRMFIGWSGDRGRFKVFDHETSAREWLARPSE